MAQQQNKHPYCAGTEHGTISFGRVNTFSNEIDACKIANGPDAGRHILGCKRLEVKRMGQRDLLLWYVQVLLLL